MGSCNGLIVVCIMFSVVPFIIIQTKSRFFMLFPFCPHQQIEGELIAFNKASVIRALLNPMSTKNPKTIPT